MTRPESDIDLYTDEALQDPWPLYRALRAQAAAVWLRPTGVYALSRYQDVRAALANWQVFSSARGVALTEDANRSLTGTTIASDPPLHDRLRAVLNRPLAPAEVRALTPALEAEAEALADDLLRQPSFDAVAALAQKLPVSVISHLVGLPEQGREAMLDWGIAANDSIGPDNQRFRDASRVIGGLFEYLTTRVSPQTLKPGSWAALAADAAARGEITQAQMIGLLVDYVTPSLHTTISGISSAIALFAKHPDQWSLLRDRPELLPGAINEVLRLETPILAFSRSVTQDYAVEDAVLEAGSRALVLYASANRDERKWTDPDRFDIQRKAADHLAFGHGEHKCVGLPLALLEIRVIIAALAKRVTRIELRDETRVINNALRAHATLEVTLH
jgi:cytochrome P450